MKIILKEDVDNLGGRGKVVIVKDGYARNFLVPRGLAMRFTPGAQKVIDQERRTFEVKQTKARDEAEAVAAKIAAVEVSVTKRAGDQEVLYGSVTPTDIADLLKAQGIVIDRRKIVLHEPIKKLGDYDIPLRLHKDVTPIIKLHVLKEE